MSGANKYRFVSPGIQIKEIDRSQINNVNDTVGPVVIGRARRGPGMVPVKVRSYEEFVQIFGEPVRGSTDGDMWREGNLTAPTYGAWAAKAYLANSSPLTFVRLMGSKHPQNSTSGLPGWKTTRDLAPTVASNGGAYGLFVMPSGSNSVTGTLAAIFYVEKDVGLALVGETPSGSLITGSATVVKSIGANLEFRLKVLNSDNVNSNAVYDTSFNFNKNSDKYIRKVFNTNPTLVTSEITTTQNQEKYWLGETFADFAFDTLPSNVSVSGAFGFLAGLEGLNDFRVEAKPAKSGWIFSQDTNSVTGSFEPKNMSRLFRFVSLGGEGSGDWTQREIKVAITNIKYSPSTFEKYGSFTVEIRSTSDNDALPTVLEVFSNVNLNPNSENYIAKRIGDKYLSWEDVPSTGEKRHRVYGNYDNVSKLVRVEMNTLVDEGGVDPELLPFGFLGPTKYKKITLTGDGNLVGNTIVKGSGSVALVPSVSSTTVHVSGLTSSFSADLVFPQVEIRAASSDAGVLSDRDTYFGVVTNVDTLAKLNEDYVDIVRIKPASIETFDPSDSDTKVEYSTIFTLDDVCFSGSSTDAFLWQKGSRVAGTSITAATGSGVTYKAVIDAGANKFCVPMFGGFDGLNIKEKEPFSNRVLGNGANPIENYTQYSLQKAVDMVSDAEVVEMNLLTAPGITNLTVTNKILDTAKLRNDTLAIIDIEGGYKPTTETNDAERQRLGNVNTAVSLIKQRNLNNNFGCTYYPWVSIDSGNGIPLWVPPSVVALGTMASSQEATAVWFAPAGFNRGGLSNGSSGLTVLDVREKLSLKQRDALYEVNVNPIASFPSEGIVIFGQKTLQATSSALDRINVRRLAIYLKEKIAKISKSVLFDPNLQVTWNRFLNQVNPLLADTKARFGVSDYKVVLDESTTTADLIDRNIMYAKVYIKPARAIEFIAIDFIITNTGASFDE
jgi:phage tail sheath protein FI